MKFLNLLKALAIGAVVFLLKILRELMWTAVIALVIVAVASTISGVLVAAAVALLLVLLILLVRAALATAFDLTGRGDL